MEYYKRKEIKQIEELLEKIQESSKKNTDKNFVNLVKLMTANAKKIYTEIMGSDIFNFEDMILNPDVSSLEEALQLDAVSAGISLIRAAQIIYNYSGASTGLTDTEYDFLRETITECVGENVLAITEPVIGGNIEYHKYQTLRGTLDKVYALTEDDVLQNASRKTLDQWIRSTEQRIFERSGKVVDLNEEYVYLFPKFDGVSCVFEFSETTELDRALSRGFTETNEAQNITHIFREHFENPYRDIEGEYGLKTEIMMTEENLLLLNQKFRSDYKNTRSVVSAILNNNEADARAEYLDVIPLRISTIVDGEETLQRLAPGVFETPYKKCKLSEREEIRNFALNNKYVYGKFRCDGVVIYLINPELQKILGRENNKQKFEVAYKFTEEVGYSKVKDVEFRVGRFGRITPVVKIHPIKLKGNTIDDISLSSYGRFKALHLSKGDIVKVLYDIVPYMVMDESDPECDRSYEPYITAPSYCNDCGEELVLSENHMILQCVNKNCPCREKGALLNYLTKMNIAGMSYATIDVLYDHGFVKKIEDFYKLSDREEELTLIPGFGELSVDAILTEIDNHRRVPYSQMLGSIGIEGVATKTFHKILSNITFDELLEYTLDKSQEKTALNLLTSINGCKDKTAKKIIEGIRHNKKLIEFLENELILIEDEKEEPAAYSVGFTNVRDKELEEWIKDHRGKVDDHFGKSSSILVVPVLGSESGKVSDAKRWGTPIVAIADVKDYILENYIGTKNIE